jgi:integrase
MDDQSYSLAEEFQLYLQTDSAQKMPRSAKADAYFLDVALHFFNVQRQKTLISQIRLEDLQLFQHWLAKEQTINGKKKKIWGDTTIEYYTRVLKKFFRKMFDTDRIVKDPCRLWKVPRGTNKMRRPLTNEEVARIYAASDDWFKSIFRFMNFTGARGASIAMLTWADVDFEKRILILKSRKGGLKQMKTILS